MRFFLLLGALPCIARWVGYSGAVGCFVLFGVEMRAERARGLVALWFEAGRMSDSLYPPLFLRDEIVIVFYSLAEM